MKKIKVRYIIIAIITIFLAVVFGAYYMMKHSFNKQVKTEDITPAPVEKKEEVEPLKKDVYNIMLLGMEHTRTDVIMVATCNIKNKTIQVVSIPRDTYVENEYNIEKEAGFKKINTVYEYPSTKGGEARLAQEVSKILGIQLNDYIKVDYDAVKELVDAVGGVDVEIPFNMYYDDPWSDPPLHIYFEKGDAHLNGDNAIEFLRWRQNSDGTKAGEGDGGRIKRHQKFMMSLLAKSLNPITLPKLIKCGFENTQTNLEFEEVMNLVSYVASIPKENIHFYQEVGEAAYFDRFWYYLPEIDKNLALMNKIQNGETIEDSDLAVSQKFYDYVLEKNTLY